MAHRAIYGMAVAAIFATGCDVSQKMPETRTLPAWSAIARPATDSALPASPQAAPGEKSIRLFGPGVSRKQQTRV
jgi:hypothetical protein